MCVVGLILFQTKINRIPFLFNLTLEEGSQKVQNKPFLEVCLILPTSSPNYFIKYLQLFLKRFKEKLIWIVYFEKLNLILRNIKNC